MLRFSLPINVLFMVGTQAQENDVMMVVRMVVMMMILLTAPGETSSVA